MQAVIAPELSAHAGATYCAPPWSCLPSRTAPSLTLPRPRMAILVLVSACIRFWVLPRGPMISPKKLKPCMDHKQLSTYVRAPVSVVSQLVDQHALHQLKR